MMVIVNGVTNGIDVWMFPDKYRIHKKGGIGTKYVSKKNGL
jgi:hypothetical protein